MKIAEMLLREDFYTINERTLERYFGTSDKQTKLFVYPKINAIVTKDPSKEVVEYLQNEFSPRNSLLKRCLARIYVFLCLHSCGCLASKTVYVSGQIDSDLLVYPCNKKFRVFYLRNHYVDVITKSGFKDDNIKHEIEFRSKEKIPSFVPPLVWYQENSYRESVIKGKPLARIREQYEQYRAEAFRVLQEYGRSEWGERIVSARSYVSDCLNQIKENALFHRVDTSALSEYLEMLRDCAEKMDNIKLVFSHGDLQSGNIWVEDETERIIIIDWESWGIRSEFYDQAVLFDDLRANGILGYLDFEKDPERKAMVLLEDLVYQFREISQLPEETAQGELEKYLKKVEGKRTLR